MSGPRGSMCLQVVTGNCDTTDLRMSTGSLFCRSSSGSRWRSLGSDERGVRGVRGVIPVVLVVVVVIDVVIVVVLVTVEVVDVRS